MANANLADSQRLYVRLSVQTAERIRYHAKRLRYDFNDLLRDGALAKIKELDLQELEEASTRRGIAELPKLPELPSVPISEAFSMAALATTVKRPEETLRDLLAKRPPEKIQMRFRRWAEYVEDAEDKIDRKMRIKDVTEQIRDFCQVEEEVNVSLNAFEAFLAERAAAKASVPPSGFMSLLGSRPATE